MAPVGTSRTNQPRQRLSAFEGEADMQLDTAKMSRIMSCSIAADTAVAHGCRLRPNRKNGAWIVLRLLGFYESRPPIPSNFGGQRSIQQTLAAAVLRQRSVVGLKSTDRGPFVGRSNFRSRGKSGHEAEIARCPLMIHLRHRLHVADLDKRPNEYQPRSEPVFRPSHRPLRRRPQ
jgi:hypothetical protein